MKLHIGCGSIFLPGWKNLDIQDAPGVDICDDALKLEKIANNSCDIIYACHILEHISRHKTCQALSLWRTKLKDDGVLRLAVPNFEAALEWYNITGDIADIMGLCVGGQTDKFDSHKMVFDKKLLSSLLIKSGFHNIRSWDWRTVSHAAHDDYSQAYLPHMDKESGLLMSLNIEADKRNLSFS